MTHKIFTVTGDASGGRLDRYLSECLPDQSRSQLQRFIDQGLITVNGEAVKKKHALEAGDRVDVEIPEESMAPLNPEPGDLDIMFEDDAILVVNKPPDMVVHPAAGNREGTLVNKLLGLNYEQFLAMMDEDERPGIVHRLDKDTSGVMVVAKTASSKRSLAAQFEKREVKKAYLAIVKGHLTEKEGMRVETLIARHRVHRKKMAVTDSVGKEAISIFTVLGEGPSVSLVQADILTGRTHQIRVHLTHLGHPILGDSTYGKAGSMAPRQMLHAWKLTIRHPLTDQPMTFTARPPMDFMDSLASEGITCPESLR